MIEMAVLLGLRNNIMCLQLAYVYLWIPIERVSILDLNGTCKVICTATTNKTLYMIGLRSLHGGKSRWLVGLLSKYNVIIIIMKLAGLLNLVPAPIQKKYCYRLMMHCDVKTHPHGNSKQ